MTFDGPCVNTKAAPSSQKTYLVPLVKLACTCFVTQAQKSTEAVTYSLDDNPGASDLMFVNGQSKALLKTRAIHITKDKMSDEENVGVEK